MSLQQDIRQKCAWVVSQAEHVHIAEDRILDYALSLHRQYPAIPDINHDWHLIDPARPDMTAMYILALDTINFGSGYFHHLQPRNGLTGYAMVATALKEAFLQRDLGTTEALLRLTPKDCADIFGQDIRQPDILELMTLFADSLHVTGKALAAQYDGQVSKLLVAAHHSAEMLVSIVATWPNFRDIAMYKGHDIPILKRAQILASDMSLALKSAGHKELSGMETLTAFADNLVPHVLWQDGLLAYSETLAQRIRTGDSLVSGSEEEIELRAAAVHAVERMVQALSQAGITKASFELDQILWHHGQNEKYASPPPHRTKTIWY
jgi:hypothetical protein